MLNLRANNQPVAVIARQFQVRYPLAQSHRLLGQLGWSAERPARRAKERHEAAIARWVRGRWPQVKNALRLEAWLSFWTRLALPSAPDPGHLGTPRSVLK
jgi:hypothetical protein